MSLLNKALGVPGVTQCLSAKVLWVPECPSSAPVPRVLKCPSAIGVPLEYPFSAVPNFPLSTRRVKKNCKIARNGLVNSFIEILKTFQNTNFYITRTVFSFLEDAWDASLGKQSGTWPLREPLATQKKLGDSEGTWAFRHLRQSVTRALTTLGHLGCSGAQPLGHLGTWGLRH